MVNMSSSIAENATNLLQVLENQPRPGGGDAWVSGAEIRELTGLTAEEINDAVSILVNSGLAEWELAMGTGPFNFSDVCITPRGRFELEKARSSSQEEQVPSIESISAPLPVGSPYGFTDQDWEIVSERKSNIGILYVVFGYQFRSDHYNTDHIVANIGSTFEQAVEAYNQMPNAIPIQLDYHRLAAGYGEHLFNDIARDIISSDVAVFETSDQNPNVMIELGVALTWGVRVLPIKSEETPSPPSDISGQTWVDYSDSAVMFADPQHDQKLLRLVERAARKKARS